MQLPSKEGWNIYPVTVLYLLLEPGRNPRYPFQGSAEAAAKRYFESKGYSVLSGDRLLNVICYKLFGRRGYDGSNSFTDEELSRLWRIASAFFSQRQLEDIIRFTKQISKNRYGCIELGNWCFGGGTPDFFVYKLNPKKAFFAEIKFKEAIIVPQVEWILNFKRLKVWSAHIYRIKKTN